MYMCTHTMLMYMQYTHYTVKILYIHISFCLQLAGGLEHEETFGILDLLHQIYKL